MLNRRYLFAAAILGIALLSPDDSASQTSDVLRGVDSLRRGIESPPTSRPQERVNPRLDVPKPAPWTEIKPGMSETEVMKVLGVPDRIDNQPQTFLWHWDRTRIKGWVSFDGVSRQVVEWRNF